MSECCLWAANCSAVLPPSWPLPPVPPPHDWYHAKLSYRQETEKPFAANLFDAIAQFTTSATTDATHAAACAEGDAARAEAARAALLQMRGVLRNGGFR